MTRLFDNALITVSPLALAGIWGDLVECYHGVNSYGGDTAEIYAYRLTVYSPIAHEFTDHGMSAMKRQEVAKQAANALCAIIDEFCDKYECDVTINELSLEEWCKSYTFGDYLYDHRCHVRVIKQVRL